MARKIVEKLDGNSVGCTPIRHLYRVFYLRLDILVSFSHVTLPPIKPL